MEPEARLTLGRPRVTTDRRGKIIPKFVEGLLVAGRQPIIVADLPGEIGLQVLAPLLRHHDVADVEGRVDPAGDAAEDDGA